MRLRNFYFVFVALFSTIDVFAQLPSISFGTSGNANGCAPHSVTDNISSFSGNTANTSYQLNFGDGSPVLNFTQANIPSKVSHTYTSVACGQTFQGISNSYGATLTATKK